MISYFLLFTEIVIGGILLTASFYHIRNRYAFKNTVKNYKIFESDKIISLSSVLISHFEFFLGILLISRIFNLITLIGTIFLFLIFNIAIIKNLYAGRSNIDCGCGGVLGNHFISWKLVVRNSLIIILLLFDIIYSFIVMDGKLITYSIINISIVYGAALLTLLVINTNSYLNKIKSSLV